MKTTKLALATVLALSGLNHAAAQAGGLKEHLTLYSSFDSEKAEIALGDANIYSGITGKGADGAKPGLGSNPNVALVKDTGKFGGALEFKKKSSQLTFFKSKGNINYNTQDWSGTISFWLQIDPEKDLEPGFCDPIQITDVTYNDASIWVDFTDKNPRDFRLGVLGDIKVWNPKNLEPDDNPDFESRLVAMKPHPFSRQTWTQVTITYSHLNQPNGQASLYINGDLVGSKKDIDVPFTWELDKSNIMLGLSYIGLMDELALFNKVLNPKEVKKLYKLKNGIKSIL